MSIQPNTIRNQTVSEEIRQAVDWKLFELTAALINDEKISEDEQKILEEESVSWFQPKHLEEIIEERSCNHICGYPFCYNKIEKKARRVTKDLYAALREREKQKQNNEKQENEEKNEKIETKVSNVEALYKIDYKEKKIYQIVNSTIYCSPLCIEKTILWMNKLDTRLVYHRSELVSNLMKEKKNKKKENKNDILDIIKILDNKKNENDEEEENEENIEENEENNKSKVLYNDNLPEFKSTKISNDGSIIINKEKDKGPSTSSSSDSNSSSSLTPTSAPASAIASAAATTSNSTSKSESDVKIIVEKNLPNLDKILLDMQNLKIKHNFAPKKSAASNSFPVNSSSTTTFPVSPVKTKPSTSTSTSFSTPTSEVPPPVAPTSSSSSTTPNLPPPVIPTSDNAPKIVPESKRVVRFDIPEDNRGPPHKEINSASTIPPQEVSSALKAANNPQAKPITTSSSSVAPVPSVNSNQTISLKVKERPKAPPMSERAILTKKEPATIELDESDLQKMSMNMMYYQLVEQYNQKYKNETNNERGENKSNDEIETNKIISSSIPIKSNRWDGANLEKSSTASSTSSSTTPSATSYSISSSSSPTRTGAISTYNFINDESDSD